MQNYQSEFRNEKRHLELRKVSIKEGEQKVGVHQVSLLPQDRVKEAAPLTYCTHLLGPFIIKDRVLK